MPATTRPPKKAEHRLGQLDDVLVAGEAVGCVVGDDDPIIVRVERGRLVIMSGPHQWPLVIRPLAKTGLEVSYATAPRRADEVLAQVLEGRG